MVFNDTFQYPIVNAQANSGTINSLINKGIQGAQEMIVIPVVSSSTNQLSSGGNLALPAFQSPLLRSMRRWTKRLYRSIDQFATARGRLCPVD